MWESARSNPILLVASEDEVSTRLKDALDQSGMPCITARTIADSLEIIERVRPVAALVGIQINESEDGLEAARALRSRYSIPIVFLAKDAISPMMGARLSMVPHLAVLPADIDPSFVRHIVDNSLSLAVGGNEGVAEDAEWRAQLIEGILRLSPNAVIVLDEAHRVVDWNPAATDLFGYTRAEAVGRSLDQLVVDPGDPERYREAESYTKTVLSQVPVPLTEAVRYRKDGSPIDVVLAGIPISVGGRFRGVLGYYHDNTEQIRARRRVEELLAEKEILLGEVQHRVKNDITLIESMLNLQAASYESGELREAVADAINRIASVRSVYDVLHRLRSIERVGSQPLLESLLSNHRGVLAKRGIAVETTVHDIEVSASVAISIGLVINELLTNISKYAFPPERKFDEKRVDISLLSEENDRITIAVSDTGVGMPADRGSNGYGLSFVEAIASQYRGTVTIGNRRGACIEINILLPSPSSGGVAR